MNKEAIFAGGCFWCMVQPFQAIDGVVDVLCGYTGGDVPNPTYEEVSSGRTGHYEAVKVIYTDKVSYSDLLRVFWAQIDPTDPKGQFADKRSQYRTAIFYNDDEQRRLAEASKAELEKSGKFKEKIATEILPAVTFYIAEEYHQNYHEKNPTHYQRYRVGSGRQGYLDRVWGKEVSANLSLKERLTPLQYRVTRENSTEPPFRNAYWDNKEEGIYVDVISGKVLFSSKDKFDSGTGWPSFTKPVKEAEIIEKEDRSHGMVRVEARSESSDSHLGHVFDDGPDPGGKRYCINSAALRFIPRDKLEKEGYGEYLSKLK